MKTKTQQKKLIDRYTIAEAMKFFEVSGRELKTALGRMPFEPGKDGRFTGAEIFTALGFNRQWPKP
jgi:hypothetical protein